MWELILDRTLLAGFSKGELYDDAYTLATTGIGCSLVEDSLPTHDCRINRPAVCGTAPGKPKATRRGNPTRLMRHSDESAKAAREIVY